MTGNAIIVKFSCSPDKIDDFITRAMAHAEKVRTEAGNIRCDVLRPNEDQNSVYLYELFKSQDALTEHGQMPYMKDFLSVINELTESRLRVDTTLQNAVDA